MMNNAWTCVLLGAALVCALAGCQTGAPKDTPAAKAERPADEKRSAITFSSDPDMVAALLRQAGPMISRGGVVIMNGAGQDIIPAQDFKNLGANEFARRLADAGGLKYAETGNYTFLYPEGYERLAKDAYPLAPRYSGITASAVFGQGTTLYNALAILSQSLGLSLIADNIVAQIPIGEIVLRDAPLSVLLEAMLRSARATPEAVLVESNDDFIFLHAAANVSPADNLLNASALSPADTAALDARVSFILPESARRANAAVFLKSALPLSEVAGSLARQMNLAVEFDPSMADLPVNYSVANNVPLRSALNLLIRQWPVAKFGYEYHPGRVLLRPR